MYKRQVLSDAKRNEIIQKNPARMIDLPAASHTDHRERGHTGHHAGQVRSASGTGDDYLQSARLGRFGILHQQGRQSKYAPSTLASYRRQLEVVYPYIGAIPMCKQALAISGSSNMGTGMIDCKRYRRIKLYALRTLPEGTV